MTGPLRIALVSTPHVPVPPKGYGGTELVVADLAQALARRGHDVVVYATGDSSLPGIEVRSYFPEAQWPPSRDIERVHVTWALRDVSRDPRGFDVVHVHAPTAVEMARLSPYPVVYTLHHDFDPALSDMYRRSPNVCRVAISRSQARLEPTRCAAVVHHGLDPNRFLSMEEQGYLLFLGRYDRCKGVLEAIEVAERARLPLLMAGESHEREFFENEVRPRMERHGVLELGPVAGRSKAALIARARAVLFPIQWEEPFGLVMIEALLSGVPVLGTARGSVPEIIDDGVTGIVCDDPTEMVAAARVADKLFRRDRIRTVARERWSSDRMADDYLRIYASAVAGELEEPEEDSENLAGA